MKQIACAACLLFALPAFGGDGGTNAEPASARQPNFAGLALDQLGFPTNTAVAYTKGQEDARRDLANGVLSVKTCGLPAPWASDYENLLEKRCGVKEVGIGGCIVSDGMTKYLDGYDEISCAFVQQKFGTNIFDTLENEARANWTKIRASSVYKVHAGDTLTKIARGHGLTLKALQDVNPDVEPGKLRIGQKILIPPQANK